MEGGHAGISSCRPCTSLSLQEGQAPQSLNLFSNNLKPAGFDYELGAQQDGGGSLCPDSCIDGRDICMGASQGTEF